MMGYEPGWVDGISRTGQLKALGNAIVPHQAAAAWGHLLGYVEGDEMVDMFPGTGVTSPRSSSVTPTAPQRRRTDD
jgi:hypothetical protein